MDSDSAATGYGLGSELETRLKNDTYSETESFTLVLFDIYSSRILLPLDMGIPWMKAQVD